MFAAKVYLKQLKRRIREFLENRNQPANYLFNLRIHFSDRHVKFQLRIKILCLLNLHVFKDSFQFRNLIATTNRDGKWPRETETETKDIRHKKLIQKYRLKKRKAQIQLHANIMNINQVKQGKKRKGKCFLNDHEKICKTIEIPL